MRGTLIRRRLAIPTDQEPWNSALKDLLDRMQLDLQTELDWLNSPSQSVTLAESGTLVITSPRMDVTTSGGSTVELVSSSLKGPEGFNGPLYIRKVTGSDALTVLGTTVDTGKIVILSRHAGTWYKQ